MNEQQPKQPDKPPDFDAAIREAGERARQSGFLPQQPQAAQPAQASDSFTLVPGESLPGPIRNRPSPRAIPGMPPPGPPPGMIMGGTHGGNPFLGGHIAQQNPPRLSTPAERLRQYLRLRIADLRSRADQLVALMATIPDNMSPDAEAALVAIFNQTQP